MARIVLNTFGSFGDLHPYLAIAIELLKRGHYPVVATSEVYRAKVAAELINFAPVRPDVGELLDNPKFIEKLWDPRHGSQYLLRDYVLPAVNESFEDLATACKGADLLLTHAAAYAGPIVAESLKLPWLSIALQPAILFSTFDPPVLAPALWARHFYRFGRWPFAALLGLAKLKMRPWVEPVARLRRKLGLPTGLHPIVEGQFSPFGTLALFSPHFAAPQPDWPPCTTATGFVTYDKRGQGFGTSADSGLSAFLQNGPPPVLFTLGSSAVMHPGSFYLESIKAIQQMGIRAVLLVGLTDRAHFPAKLPASIHIAEYAPYSEIMPNAAATVHQGGIGTTAQALRSGRPMLVVPWAHDQPDNAERARRLGVSRTINRSSYTANRVAQELDRLLNEPSYARASADLKASMAGEDGLRSACDEIERTLHRP